MPRKPRQPGLFDHKPHTKLRGKIIVTGIRRAEPDPQLVAEALIRLARQQLDDASVSDLGKD